MRDVIQAPNPILHEISEPMVIVDDYILELVKDMKHHLNDSICVSLSAVQLGEKIRLIGVNWGDEVIFIINPTIVRKSSQMRLSREGCLSIGHGKIPYTMRRHKIVKVRGMNLEWKDVTYKSRDLLGCAFQHEIDHLDGRLISDPR